MTNSQIANYAKLTAKYLVFLSAIILVLVFMMATDGGTIIMSFIGLVFTILIFPLFIMILLRIYNLLAYGKFVVEE